MTEKFSAMQNSDELNSSSDSLIENQNLLFSEQTA